jgi:RNA polymerase sigma-70 factor (ECF subfamily)
MDGRLSTPAPSDEALAARVAQRDPAALTALYDRYARPIYTLAAHLLGPAEAEEVVQDVFLRLWHKADQFDPDRSRFGTWLMAVARHRVLDELRRRGDRRRAQTADEIDRVLARVVDPSVDLEADAWRREWGDRVRRALGTLPEDQRRVLVLAYFGGLSQSALARQLGWPLGTVKKRVRLGLQKLRTALAQEGWNNTDRNW